MPMQAPVAAQPLARRPRRAIVVVACVVLLLLVLAVLTGYLARRALVAKAALEDAQQQLGTIRSALASTDGPGTAAIYTRVQADTAKAVAQTDDPVWWLAEHVPVAGANLVAFRQTAELIDTFVRDGVGPLARAADGLTLAGLTPHDGGIDIGPLKALTPAVAELDDAIQAADAGAAAIRTTHVVPQLRDPITRLQALLSDAAPSVHTLRRVMPVLYPALGGEGTRRYLLIFQNNAEERASGGNPGSMAMLVVRNGRIRLGRQASSTQFPKPYPEPPYTPRGPGNGDWDTVYTDYASTYVTNITMTPDYPSTARMARAMWRDLIGGPVDGVISFDPVALSYLLQVTGPVTLADGYTIDSTNAVSYLLYDVYAKYSDSKKQDAVFASAAQAIFAAVTDGRGDLRAYREALRPIVAEQRLKLWSVRRDEQRLLADSAVGTMMPADDAEATVFGVYNNDDATSKMSYFMDQKVQVTADRCGPQPRYTVTATVTNTLPADRADSLPEYVKAHQKRIPAGGDRQWVQLYGPVGSTLAGATLNGRAVRWGTNLRHQDNTRADATGAADQRPAVRGTMYGRPVGVVSLKLGPASSGTVSATFVGRPDDNPVARVSHTPKVRPTPVSITEKTC